MRKQFSPGAGGTAPRAGVTTEIVTGPESTPPAVAYQEARHIGPLAESVAINAGLRSLAYHVQAGNLDEAAKLTAALGRCWSDLRRAA